MPHRQTHPDDGPCYAAQDLGPLLRVTWVGLVINLVLAAVKVGAGLAGSSRAVVADGVHSLTDLATDVAVLAGARLWNRPPDETHPYGHGRIETIITVGIGLALFGVAVGIVRGAFLAPDGGAHRTGLIAVAAAALSIVVKEWLYRWTAAAGKRVGSQALQANAWHHRSDAVSSIPAMLAAGSAALAPSLWWVDRAGAVAVSLFIFKAALDIAWPALSQLADRGAGRETVDRLARAACEVEGVLGVHALRSRFLGSHLIVDLHLEVDPDITVAEGHDIAEAVKRRLVDGEAVVVDVVVHVEPHPTGARAAGPAAGATPADKHEAATRRGEPQ
ncbi:MAG: cation transporter [Desulfovibrionaceae bacterium]|nr:cation transporter [Desulfovibrionaceae bacterium]